MTPVVFKAVVLRTRPFSETSLWARLYTHSHGKISGIAKGARKGADRILAPLTEVELKGYPPRSGGDGLWTLSRPEVNEDWRELAGRSDLVGYALALLEVCDRTLHEGEPHEALYDALTTALAALPSRREATGAAVLLWFLIRLVDELGYTVQYELCPRCQKPLVYPVGPFVADAGGVLCADCSRGLKAMSQEEWEVLVTIAGADGPPEVAVKPELRAVWMARLLGHLSLHSDRPLQLESLKLMVDPPV